MESILLKRQVKIPLCNKQNKNLTSEKSAMDWKKYMYFVRFKKLRRGFYTRETEK